MTFEHVGLQLRHCYSHWPDPVRLKTMAPVLSLSNQANSPLRTSNLRPLAEAGHGNAQYQFGLMYEYGRSYAKSAADAVYWYKKSAMAEHVFAQYDLAFMHLAGKGATRDLVQAYMWLKIAELQGNNLMTKHLRLVARGMTAAEINQSHRLAYQWFAG